MAEILKKGGFGRLEDFISLANEGKDVHVTVELRKQVVVQKVHPGDTEEMKDEVGMFSFSVILPSTSAARSKMFQRFICLDL